MGPNGTGKSMSLQNIEYECDKENIICRRYSNKHNDIVQNWSDISDLFSAFRSEGERIIDSVEKWASRELVKDLLTNEEDMYILFDELDSGLSLDRMYYFFSQLTYILVSEKTKHPNRIIKFIFTCNSYEMYEYFKEVSKVPFKAIWIPTKDIMTIENYSEFKKLYLEYYNKMFKFNDKEDKDGNN
mgnify:FL=1